MIVAKKIINFNAEIYEQNNKLVTNDLLSFRGKILIKTNFEINATLRPKIIALDSYDNGFIVGKVLSVINDTIIGITDPVRYIAGSEIEIITRGHVIDPGLVGLINQTVYCNLSGQLTTIYSSAQPSLKIGRIVKLNPTVVDINVGEETSGLDADSIINEDSEHLDNINDSYELAFRILQVYNKSVFYKNETLPIFLNLEMRDISNLSNKKFIITYGTNFAIYDNGVWTNGTATFPNIAYLVQGFTVIGQGFIWGSADNGATWGSVGTVPNSTWTSRSGTVMVGGGGAGGFVARNTSGNTWVSGVFPGGYALRSVAQKSPSLNIAVAGTQFIAKSVDTANWTSIDTNPIFSESRNWMSVTTDGRRIVMIANSGTHRLAYTEDGVSWTQVIIPLNAWRTITYVSEIKTFIGTSSSGPMLITKNLKDFIYHSNYDAFTDSGKIVCDINGFLMAPFIGSSTTVFKSAEL